MVKPARGGALHGGDVFAAARDLGLSWREVLDYSANVNPLGPPPGLKRFLEKNFDLIRHYPDPYAYGWREQVAERHGLSPGEVLAGNGTTALLYLLPRVLRPRRPVSAVPAFAEYGQALRVAGLEGQEIACRARDDFDLTPAVVDRLFRLEPDLLFLANPTSPAGRLVSPEILDRVLSLARRRKTFVALDEAFLDFTRSPSLAGLVRRHPRLIVLRSLTKFYALPGLRLGYLTAAAPVAARLLAAAEPWSVNALAQAAGFYCLDQAAYTERTRRLVQKEREWLARRLADLSWGRVVPGAANYLLFQIQRPGLTEAM
ncbi:MAG: aminotransferase class I/II-fold pyridoxal phosphate-dependent enzyme, partial [Thermodesulfobacteriota bacterium]